MRICHTSDWHGGFRAFTRTSPGGLNQREMDCAVAIGRVIDGMIAARPDVVLIAGDVFHRVHPTNHAIQTVFSQLQRLRTTLPNTRIFWCAGNHELPRESGVGCILPLYRALGVDVAITTVERYDLGEIVVTAVPSCRSREVPQPVPERRNVLVMHGDVAGYGAREGLAPTAFDGWEYVGLGHWHTVAEVAPRVWYSGATEFTSSDPWSEVRQHPAKGWLLVDLPSEPDLLPLVAFQPIDPPRRYLDLAPLDAAGLSADVIDAEIAARCEGIDDAVARLVVENISRPTQHALNHAMLAEIRGRAFQFHLVCRQPVAEQSTVASRARTRQRLEEIVDAFLVARELPPDVDRAEFQRLGREYLEAATGMPDAYTGEVK
jgi:exonuclease SbcD